MNLAVGLFYAHFIMGSYMRHSIISSVVVYLLALIAPRSITTPRVALEIMLFSSEYVHVLIYVWALGYLLIGYAFAPRVRLCALAH